LPAHLIDLITLIIFGEGYRAQRSSLFSLLHSPLHSVYGLLLLLSLSLVTGFLPGTSLEPAVTPAAQASSFTLQYFPYFVWCSKYSCLL
jgi:hypothetical protein